MMIEYRLIGICPHSDNEVTYEGVFNSDFLLARVFKGTSHGGDDNMFSIKTPNACFEYYSTFKEDIEAVFDGLKQVLCSVPVNLDGIGYIKPISIE